MLFKDLKINWQGWEITTLILVILFSFAIRWLNIEDLPYGLEGDEFGWTATALFLDRKIPPTNLGVYSLHEANAKIFPVSIKLDQLAFRLFGTDFLSARKMLILVTAFSLITFYLLARQVLSAPGSLATLFMYSLSTYKLITSRIALPGAFSELFVYSSLLFLILTFSPKREMSLRMYLFILLSGIFISLSMLTYNLAYFLPTVGLVTLFIFSIQKRFSFRQILVLIIFFLLPIVISSRLWWPGVKQEIQTKSYVLGNGVVNFQKKDLNFSAIKFNIKTAKEIFIDSLKYSTSDMLVSYPAPIVNRLTSLLFLLGVFFAFIDIKRFFWLLVWLFGGGVGYHILLGLNSARMWILTVGLVYLFAGVCLDKLWLRVQNSSLGSKTILLTLSVIILAYFFLSDFKVYQNYALANASYLPDLREIVELTKDHPAALSEDLYFIVEDGKLPPNPVNSIYTVAAFYYLSENPTLTQDFSNQGREDLNVLTLQEFKEKILSSEKGFPQILLINQTILDPLRQFLLDQECLYKEKPHQFFNEVIIINC